MKTRIESPESGLTIPISTSSESISAMAETLNLASLNRRPTFERLQATEEERKEMHRVSCETGRTHYEVFEAYAKEARSQEEYDYYKDWADRAFKRAEALVFGM